MPSKPSKHAQPDNFDTDDNDPQWDTSNMHLPKYHMALCETIDDDSTYTSLIEHGYVTHKGTHYFVSVNHLERYVKDLLPTGDASSPTIIGDNDFAAIPPTATVNPKAVATDDSSGIELSDKTKIHKRYTVNPEVVRDLDTRLGSRIRDTIQDKSTQRRLKQDTDNAGRAMLKILKAKRDKVDASINQADEPVANFNERERTGILAPTVAEFNAYKSDLLDLNALKPSSLRSDETALKNFYMHAARQFGTTVRQSLKLELADLRSSGRPDDLATMEEAITTVFTECEKEAAEAHHDKAHLAYGAWDSRRTTGGKGKGARRYRQR